MHKPFKDPFKAPASSTPSGPAICEKTKPAADRSISIREEALLLIGVGLIFLVLGMVAQLHPSNTPPGRALARFIWEVFGPMSKAFCFYSLAFILMTIGISKWKNGRNGFSNTPNIDNS